MTKREEYYRPTIPRSLEKTITDLFEKYPDIGSYFDNNKVKFIEDAIRKHLIYFEEFSQKKDD